jgi:RNA-directed DNA polymerase
MTLYDFVEQQRPELKQTLRLHTLKIKFFPGVTKHMISAGLMLSLENAQDVCAYFQLPRAVLEQLINSPKYKSFSIAKKRGGVRSIEAPEPRLMQVQRALNHGLQSLYMCNPDPAVFGFVINEDNVSPASPIVQNALPHVGKPYVLNIDLKDFFPSIRAHRVKEMFLSDRFRFNDHTATVLTLLTTHQGHLPQGAPTSPIITNFICAQMDEAMRNVSLERAWTYTRYADDLTFSADVPFREEAIAQIRSIVEFNCFVINEKKIRQKGLGKRKEVTGIVVNMKANVKRNQIRQVRAMLFDLERNGRTAAAANHFKNSPVVRKNDQDVFLNRLRGYISFIGQVRGKDDPIYLRFQGKLQQLM